MRKVLGAAPPSMFLVAHRACAPRPPQSQDPAVAEYPRVSVLNGDDHLPVTLRSIFPTPRPVLVLVGGASGLTEPEVHQLAEHLRTFVLPVISRMGAVVIDGGTDSGVMRAIGRTRRDAPEPFPLVGVIPHGVLATGPGNPDMTGDPVVLEPHHTDLLVVPGGSWGDEVPWLGRVASAVRDPSPPPPCSSTAARSPTSTWPTASAATGPWSSSPARAEPLTTSPQQQPPTPQHVQLHVGSPSHL